MGDCSHPAISRAASIHNIRFIVVAMLILLARFGILQLTLSKTLLHQYIQHLDFGGRITNFFHDRKKFRYRTNSL